MGCCPRMTLQGYGSRPILLFPAVPTGIPFPVDPDIDGTLSLTDPARILFPAVLTEFPVSINPVVALVPPDPTESDKGVDDLRVVAVAAVATQQSTPDQVENFVDCWRVQLPRLRSQLRFRRWKGCSSVWWRRLRCDSLFR